MDGAVTHASRACTARAVAISDPPLDPGPGTRRPLEALDVAYEIKFH